jgi:hypothetical protein
MQLVRADVRCILVSHATGVKRFIGNGERVFAGFGFPLSNRESVLADEGFVLKTDELDDDVIAHGVPGTDFSSQHRLLCFRLLTQKRGESAYANSPLSRLEAGDVRCLQTLGATGNFEFNRLAFVQRLISLRLNGGEMNENIFAGLALNEPESLAGIEPLHCSLFSH